MTIKSEGNYVRYAIADRDRDLQNIDVEGWAKAETFKEVTLFEDLPSMSVHSNELANEGYFIVEVMIRTTRD